MILFTTNICHAQNHLDVEGHAKIRGNIDIHHMDDPTSLLIGTEAGISTDFSTNKSITIVGARAGTGNSTGRENSFFGTYAGNHNSTGYSNSFAGYAAGFANELGYHNSFFGDRAGSDNENGFNNSFFGASAGSNIVSGSNNTMIGHKSNSIGIDSLYLSYATAIGAFSEVRTNNTIVLGRPMDAAVVPGRLIVGQGIPTIPDGLGTAVHINAGEGGDAELIIESDINNAGSENHNPAISLRQDGNTINAFMALEGISGTTSTGTIFNALLIGSERNNVPLQLITNDSSRMTIRQNGHVVVNKLGFAGSTQLCRNGLLELSTCSSSIRYKKEIHNYHLGLELIHRLRPVSYQWKADDSPDLGFIAEEIAKIDERLITRNKNGEVEGVKYDRLTIVLVNAIKELNEKNDQLQKESNAILANYEKRLSQLEEKEQKQAENEKRTEHNNFDTIDMPRKSD